MSEEERVLTADPEALPDASPEVTASDASLRVKVRAKRDKLIQQAATHLIQMGRQNPGLRDAGLWLYGTATFFIPRGKEIPKLGSVGPHVFRGGQPSLRAFDTLKDLGVDTVINLRPESDHERKMVQRLGMKYIYMPLPPLDAPTIAVTMEFLDAVTNPENGEVFFHCFHGVDRTGAMAACLRVARDDWTTEQAIAEMRAFGVHEKGQRAKLDYIAAFADHWASLSLTDRLTVLHRPLPEEEAATEPPTPPAWWARPVVFAKAFLARWREKDQSPS